MYYLTYLLVYVLFTMLLLSISAFGQVSTESALDLESVNAERAAAMSVNCIAGVSHADVVGVMKSKLKVSGKAGGLQALASSTTKLPDNVPRTNELTDIVSRISLELAQKKSQQDKKRGNITDSEELKSKINAKLGELDNPGEDTKRKWFLSARLEDLGRSVAADASLKEITDAYDEAIAGLDVKDKNQQLQSSLNSLFSIDLAKSLSEGAKAGCGSLMANKSFDAALADASKAAGLDAVEMESVRATPTDGGNSEYWLYTGTVQSLEEDGGFRSGLEVSLVSRSDYINTRLPIKWIKKDNIGHFELTFSQLGEIESEEAGAPQDSTNPFEVGGGFLRINAAFEHVSKKNNNDNPIFGIQLGAGLTTQPSEADTDVDARSRFFLGPVFHADFGEDTDKVRGLGTVYIGYARDKFWEFDRTDPTTMVTSTEDESDRIFVDARITVPGIFKNQKIRIAGRLFADVPASGSGPSDIRISLLLTTDLGTFLKGS